jgi:hypothetical protein
MSNPVAVTLDFRGSQEVTLGPGKSYDIPLTHLRDGHRGVSRNLYWTEPGEYTLTATYQLADKEGNKGPLLKSKPVKVKVEEKK